MASSPPIIEILQLYTNKPRLPNDSSELSIFLRQCKFPFIERTVLKDISDSLNSKIGIVDALSKISDLFTFSLTELELLRQFSNSVNSDTSQKLPMMVCFSNCIAFLLHKNNAESYVDNLISVLNTLFSLANQNYIQSTSFLYFTILTHFLEPRKYSFSPKLFSSVPPQLSSDYFLDSPESIIIISKMLANVPDNENLIRQLIYESIQKLLTNYIKENIEFCDSFLANAIQSRVESLDPETLSLLPLLAKNRPSKHVSNLYSLLPNSCSSLQSDFDNSLELFCPPCDFEYAEWNDSFANIDLNFAPDYDDNLNSSFIYPNIDKSQTTGSYLPMNFRKQLKSLLPILNDIHYTHINSFFKAYKGLLEKKFELKNYLSLMYFITHIKFYHDIEEPVFLALLQKSLFNPTVTLFNNTTHFEATSFYRDRVIMIAIVHAKSLLPKLFELFGNYPFLYAETVIRILSHLPKVMPNSLCSQSTLQSLLTEQHRLDCISFKMPQSQREIAVQARSAVYTLIFDIFMNPLPSEIVLDNLLPALMNKSFSTSLYSRLNENLRISNCIFLKNSFNILKYSRPPEPFVERMMETVTDTVLNDPDTTSLLLLSLFDFLEYNRYENILKLTLDLIIIMLNKTHHCILAKGVFSKMSVVIPKIFAKTDVWKNQLFAMLSMSAATKVGDRFLITNPYLLITVFSIFMNYQEHNLIFTEMLELCNYSSYNRISLYEGEIDLLLLEMIFHFPNDFYFRSCFMKNIKDEEELFDKTIPLFLRIAVTQSSEVVAERMLRIISPRENGKFSTIASKFLKLICPLRTKLAPMATLAFPISIAPPYFDISEIPLADTMKASTALFWLYLDPFLSSKLTLKSTVFKIELPKFTFFEVYLTNATLNCSYQTNKKVPPATQVLFQSFPVNTWCMVAVKFRTVSKLLKVYVSIICDKPLSSKLSIPYKSPKSLFSTYIVGNTTRFHGNRGLLSCVYQLDGFFLYDRLLANAEIQNIYKNEYKHSPLYYNPLFGHPSYVGFEPKRKVAHISHNQTRMNLINVLQTYYPIDRFLPVFDSLDLCTPEYSIDLLKGLKGLFGSAVVKSFQPLSYFLNKTKQPLLFDHYLALFDFLTECSTEKEKHSLIVNLLCNMDIWIRVDCDELAKIIRHITTVLFDTCTSYFLKDEFFPKLLGFVRIYFDILEKKYLLFSKNDFPLQYEDNILLKRSERRFEPNDLETLILTILCTTNKALLKHLLRFYPKLNQTKLNSPYTRPLILLSSFDFQSNIELFSDFCSCIHNSSPDLYKSACLLLFQLNTTFWYDSFLNALYQYPELFSFAMIAALKWTQEQQSKLSSILLSYLKSKKYKARIKQCQFWMLWPIILSLQTTDDISHNLILFIANLILSPGPQDLPNLVEFNDLSNFSSNLSIDTNSLYTSLFILKLLQSMTSINTIPVQLNLLTDIYDKTGKDMSSRDLEIFIKYLFFVIYTTLVYSMFSTELITSFVNSPFTIPGYTPKETVNEITSMYQLKHLFTEAENEKLYFQIAIHRLTNDTKRILPLVLGQLNKNNQYVKVFKYIARLEEFKQNDANGLLDQNSQLEASSILEPSSIETQENDENQLKQENEGGSVNQEKKNIIQTLKKLNRLIDLNIVPYIERIKDLAEVKKDQLSQFFGQFVKPLNELKTIKIEDPLNPILKELTERREETQRMGNTLMRDFTPFCQNIAANSNDTKWKRKFIFSKDYNCVLLKNIQKRKINNKQDDSSISHSNSQLFSQTDKIIGRFNCSKITIASEIPCQLFICKNVLILNFTSTRRLIHIKTSSLRSILTRNRIQQPTALEFFTTEGPSYLLDFTPIMASQVLKVLQHIRMKNLVEKEDSDFKKFISQNQLVSKWAKGEITNFDFLLKLNIYTGRSFHDPQNSIIFPWIVLSKNKWRDLAQPITLQNPNRLQHFKELIDMQGYMFGTSPSNPMLLTYYFVRIEPYTTLHLKIHDGHYDAPERMFKNIHTFFSTLLNGDEWKEATPEFYSFPEMFLDLHSKTVKDHFSSSNLGLQSSRTSTITDIPEAPNERENDESIHFTDHPSNQVFNEEEEEMPKSIKGVNTLSDDRDGGTNNRRVKQPSNLATNEAKSNISENSGKIQTISEAESNVNQKVANNSELTIEPIESNDYKTTSETKSAPINESDSKNTKSDQSKSKSDNPLSKSEQPASKSEPVESKSDQSKSTSETDDSKSDQPASKNESVDSQSDKAKSTRETAESKSDTDESKSDKIQSKSESIGQKSNHSTSENETDESKSENDELQSDKPKSKTESGDQKSNQSTSTSENDETESHQNQKNDSSESENESKKSPTVQDSPKEENEFLLQKEASESETEPSLSDNINSHTYSQNVTKLSENNTYSSTISDNHERRTSTHIDDQIEKHQKETQQINTSSDKEEHLPLITPDNSFNHQEMEIGDLVTDYASIFDFIYRNRQMLESEYVSRHLGEWVSLLWGEGHKEKLFIPYLYKDRNEDCPKEVLSTMLENLGSVPVKVFDTKLPKRFLNTGKCQFDQQISVRIKYDNRDTKYRQSSSAFITEKNGITRVIICFMEGTIQRYSVNFAKGEAEPVYLSPLKLKIPSDAKFVMQRETVFVFDEKSDRIHCVNFEQLKTVNTKIGPIDFALPGTNFGELITTTKSGLVRFWRFPEFNASFLFSISIESISAAAVNQSYGVFICATNDGYLRTYSIEQKCPLATVKLGGRSIVIVEKIISTENFGFIILFTPGFLYLFTINAFLIKKVPINFEVYQWTTFKDQSGFDFVCCADPTGNVFVFEAYMPKRIEQIAACHERIISISYLPTLHAIIAHASSSTIYFIPYK